MPIFLMQLKWTATGFDNLKNGGAPGTRTLARAAATNNQVTVIEIIDTLQGPNWTVKGTQANVNALKAVFDNNPNVTTKITKIFTSDEDSFS